jgi:two-component system, OmpR family, alkaline phosphatase synthesis response regulator PhoP
MKKVVIIEDDTQAQETYQSILAQHNFQVFPATTGQLGLQLARSEKPSVIILDLMLPDNLSGLAVLDKIKKDTSTKSIPVIVISSLHTSKDLALSRGASDFLSKTNTSIDDLVAKISQYAQN